MLYTSSNGSNLTHRITEKSCIKLPFRGSEEAGISIRLKVVDPDSG